MVNRTLRAIFLLLLIGPLGPSDASAISSADKILAEVQAQAREDARAQKSQRPGSELQVLFGQEAEGAGIGMRQIVIAYEEEYIRSKPVESRWQPFLPNAGWIVAILLFFLLLFRDALQKTLGALIEIAQKRIYNRFAGHPLFRRKALRSYRKELQDKYQEIVLPFRPGRPLQMREVYVPLKAQGPRDAELIEAQAALAVYPRLMVVGPPGSGKSMLFKNLALSYAEGRTGRLPPQSVPILLELNRLNEGDRPLRDHLVEILELNGFPHSEQFVERGLEEGVLVLLFDGLDEVNSARRDIVVGKIKHLLGKYKSCRVAITCRSAVYHDEFLETVDQTLEIVELSDQQIRSFLASWQPSMPEGKSIEQLVQALRDRPQIMALARNPLMLTIIAFLYTDTAFVLPHSRAEFYDQAIGVLLLPKQGTHNSFKAPSKRLVLQHLALFNQSTGSQDRQDRRSIDLPTVLREVKLVLPDLNIRGEDAQPILDEIVERSGLLLAIDGGERYQFAHLTLQEFFAAKALESKPDEVFSRFEKDRDAWRETIKLWCGLDHDSTALVQRVFGIDPITAFECLADAQQISPALADQIIGYFKERLSIFKGDADAILRAFAAVASDFRPRGKMVFDFLVSELNAKVSPILLVPLATVLSFTNLKKAAEVLASRYSEPEVRTALARMGDLAVPLLLPHAQKGSLEALNDLQAIGTPLSATALTSLLWEVDLHFSFEAAVRLSNFFGKADVEEALRRYPLTDENKGHAILPWVWEPFSEPANSSLPCIAGRVGFLIDHHINEVCEIRRISMQVALPLAVNIRSKLALKRPELGEINYRKIDSLSQEDQDFFQENLEAMIEDVVPEKYPRTRRLACLLKCVPWEQRWDIFVRLAGQITPNLDDWRHIFRPVQYRFQSGNYYRAVISLACGVTLFALLEIVERLRITSSSSLVHVWPLLALLSIVVGWYCVMKPPRDYIFYDMDPLGIVCTSVILLPAHVWVIILDRDLADWDDWKAILNLSLSIGFLPSLCYYATMAMLPQLGPSLAVATWIVFGGVIGFLYVLGYKKDRRARNPLAGALPLPSG